MKDSPIVQRASFYERYVKRALDFTIALLLCFLFCWILAILAILVRVKLGSPVLFKQKRPGRIDPATGQERIFEIYKFRTMTDERDDNGSLLPDEVRLTKFGKLLRSTSLDELPEAFNIIKGDMALVGPRPLLVEYLPRYSERQRHRHDVCPGLTGWAQVNGRNSVTWEQKFDLDLEYVENISFKMDLYIFGKSITTMLKHDGISSKTSATMETFVGSDSSEDAV